MHSNLDVVVCLQIKCNEEVTRRVNNSSATTGFAGTVELCFATGPLALRKYSVFMRYVYVWYEDHKIGTSSTIRSSAAPNSSLELFAGNWKITRKIDYDKLHVSYFNCTSLLCAFPICPHHFIRRFVSDNWLMYFYVSRNSDFAAFILFSLRRIWSRWAQFLILLLWFFIYKFINTLNIEFGRVLL